MSETVLLKVTIERRTVAGATRYPWAVVRDRGDTGETFHARDLIEAFSIVRQAYLADGTPRPWPACEIR